MVNIGELEVYGIIYKITNTVNGKVYIGQTTKRYGFNGRYANKGVGIERVYNFYKSRKDRGKNYNAYLYHSIRKYGFSAFTVDEVFDTADSQKELDEKEICYIEQFDSFANGYNATPGGSGGNGQIRLGKKNIALSKSVCQISLDGELIKIWDSMADVHRELGVEQSKICCVCRGQRKTAGGFVWVYADEYDESVNYSRRPYTRDADYVYKDAKAVVLIDDAECIIEEFRSIHETARKLNIPPKTVSAICRRRSSSISTPKYNLYFKNEYEYMKEQRLNKEGHTNIA